MRLKREEKKEEKKPSECNDAVRIGSEKKNRQLRKKENKTHTQLWR